MSAQSGRVRREGRSIIEPMEPRVLLSTTYYLSPSGNNGASGTSPAAAWKTISKVNSRNFGPGDTILFQGGATFSGGLNFDQNDDGQSGAPIRLGSYGTGRATISSGNAQALSIHNSDWFEVSDLIFVGSGRTNNSVDGFTVWNDMANGQFLHHLYVDNVESRGFGRNGIAIGGSFGSKGYKDVRVTNSVVRENGINGLIIWGAGTGTNEDVYISHVLARDNAGVAGVTWVSGSGILIESTKRATLERSIATNNGFVGTGGIGLWAHTSDQVLIQYNESYNNRTASAYDGGGFGFDGGTTNSILQYNYSHGNDGAAIGLYQFGTAPAWGNNIIRYNISENDGRRNGYGVFTTWNGNGSNGLNGAQIYGNTVFLSAASQGSPQIVKFLNGTVNFSFRNNNFITTGGARFISNGSSHSGLLFQGNNYWSSGSAFNLLWNGTNYTSLSSWRTASGQEKVSGASVGLSVDPKVTSPGGGGTIGNADALTTLAAYKLQSGSPLIDAGLNLQSLFGTVPVNDFWGGSVPRGGGWDVGAFESDETGGGGGGGGGGGTVFPESGGRVNLEAETSSAQAAGTGAAAGHTWTSFSDAAASGGSALVSNPNSGLNVGESTSGPRQDYAINFTTTGTYYVWVRMSGSTGNDDSVHMGFKGSPITFGAGGVALTSAERGAGWIWKDRNTSGTRITFNVASTGTHTFNLWMREDGTRVDQFILTKDAAFNPGGGGGGGAGFTESGGRVDMEAEASTGQAGGSGAAASHVWNNLTDATASGGTALVANPNSGVNLGDSTAGPRRDYTINFTNTGTYYVWVRMNGPSGNDDSLHMGFNGSPITFGAQGVALASAERGTGWYWKDRNSAGTRVTLNVTTAGVHTFNLWMREDGMKVDGFILTKDAAFNPGGGGGGGAGFTENGGRVDIEAEASTGQAAGSGAAASHTWNSISDATANGGTAIVANPNNGINLGDSTAGPRRDYTINFTNTGTYFAWVRMNGPTGSDDSLHLGFNGSPITFGAQGVALASAERGTGWYWKDRNSAGTRVTLNVTTAGVHTFNLWMREDGMKVDGFILTKDASFVPA